MAQEGMGAVPTRRQVVMAPSKFSRATSALRRGVDISLGRSGPSITSTLLYWLHDRDRAADRQWDARPLISRLHVGGVLGPGLDGRQYIRIRGGALEASSGVQHRVAALCAAPGVVA